MSATNAESTGLRDEIVETVRLESVIGEELRLLTERELRARSLLLSARDRVLRRDQEQASVNRHLQAAIAALRQDAAGQAAAVADAFSKHRQYQRLIGHIREILPAALPVGATVLVVSKGDDELLQLDGRQGWHFPQDETGVYAGYYPVDSAEAIARLEELRAKGAGYLLFPSTAFWWLDHYGELRQHLDGRYRRVWADLSCVIYDLTPAGAQPGTMLRADRLLDALHVLFDERPEKQAEKKR